MQRQYVIKVSDRLTRFDSTGPAINCTRKNICVISQDKFVASRHTTAHSDLHDAGFLTLNIFKYLLFNKNKAPHMARLIYTIQGVRLQVTLTICLVEWETGSRPGSLTQVSNVYRAG